MEEKCMEAMMQSTEISVLQRPSSLSTEPSDERLAYMIHMVKKHNTPYVLRENPQNFDNVVNLPELM